MRISDWSSDVCSSDLVKSSLAGGDFTVVENEGRAREIAEYRQRSRREKEFAATGRGPLERMLSRIKEGEASELPVVEIGRAHVRTPVTTAHLVCRPPVAEKNM